MIETLPVGSLRIVEREGGFGGPGWAWRFRVEKLMPGGKFLFWKWGPAWRTVTEDQTHQDCRAYIERDGRFERVVETFAPKSEGDD